ncbi:MAG TPA: ATP-binding protein [Candidatus Acidoferrales bacterium]|nr:ATP-binding protein [Candidatus Acidoferrales bacterium]
MSHLTVTNLTSVTSGLLQCAVFGYGLWLTRSFGTARVGWSLVSIFSVLALLRVFPFQNGFSFGVQVDVIFSVIALLLLASMVQLEMLLRERLQLESVREEARLELETRIGIQTAELTQVNGELRQTAERLKAEVEERSRMQQEAEKIHKEMLIVSRQAGMSDVATGVLHNVGNVLNSVNVSANLVANHVQELKINRLNDAVRLMQQNAEDLGNFIMHDTRGKQLPNFLQQLGKHLSKEQSLLLQEMEFVKTKIEHIKQIVATQQDYGRVSGVAEKVRVIDLVEDLLRIHKVELEEHNVHIQREYQPDLPEISVDKHKVLQILLNLTSNAKHACMDSRRDKKLVTVRVTNGDGRIRVAVGDNGVGISAENIKKIFNHGFTTRKKGGHGFGLHSGALAARELGGALLAQSDGPDQGATFTLELPLKPKHQTYES